MCIPISAKRGVRFTGTYEDLMMVRFSHAALFAFLLIVVSSPLAAKTTCEEVRASIDIGSGTTKMVVALVDVCSLTIKSVLAPRPGQRIEIPVEWKKGIMETDEGRKIFRPEIETAGFAALAKLRQIGLVHGAQNLSAVATSAFREVAPDYATELAARIHDQLGVPIYIIGQSEEARLGFLAAVAKLHVPRSEVLVWDIGGGSMQISVWNEMKRSVTGYEGNFANNAMQSFVVDLLRRDGIAADVTPNPILTFSEKISPDNRLFAAIRKAEESALSTATPEQLARFRTLPEVIGIGGVHVYSNCEVTNQSPECEVDRDELQAAIMAHADLTDEQLVEVGRASRLAYASKRITAGALTVGFMEAFGFPRVRSLKINMADGILVDSAYWR